MVKSWITFLSLIIIASPFAYGSENEPFDPLTFCRDVISKGSGRGPVTSVSDGKDPIEYGGDNPWDQLQYPSESSRRMVFESVLNIRFVKLDGKKLGELDFLSLSNSVHILKDSIKVDHAGMFDPEFQTAKKFAWLLCGYYSPLDTFSCAKALKYQLDLSRPSGDVAYPALYNEVLHDRKAISGIFLVADRIKRLVNSGNLPSTRLFEDLETAYRKLGDDTFSAKERAWNVMGLFATGGANTASRIRNYFERTQNTDLVSSAILLVTTGTEVLNARTVEHNFLYSLPRNVISRCDNGKSYHFWMPAYLAHKATSVGISEGPSRLAAWLPEVGYQMMSRSFGRVRERPFTVTWNELGNQKIRLDLAYAAAGAVYGSTDGDNLQQTINLDVGLSTMLEHATHKKPLSEAEARTLYESKPAKTFLRWTQLFAPKSGYDAIRQSAGL